MMGSTGLVSICISLTLVGLAAGNWIQLGAGIVGTGEFPYLKRYVSLSADGNRVAIGAPYGTNAGTVRVFELNDNGRWSQLGANITGLSVADKCGTSVSLSANGSRLAVGAPDSERDGDFGRDRGQISLYDLRDGNWTLFRHIYGARNGDNFGNSVSLSADGSKVAVGAPSSGIPDMGRATRYGSVQVHSLAGCQGQIGADIVGEVRYDNAGRAVSLSADGSRFTTNMGNHVRVYALAGEPRYHECSRTGRAWTQVGADIVTIDSGTSLSLSADGSRVAVGEANHNGPAGAGRFFGRVRVYELTGCDGLLSDAHNANSYVRSSNSYCSVNDTFIDTSAQCRAAATAFGQNFIPYATISDVGSPGCYYLPSNNLLVHNFRGNRTVNRSTSTSFDSICHRGCGGAWIQIGADINGDNAYDFFGASVSLSADGAALAVGATGTSSYGGIRGKVRVYELHDGTWTQTGADMVAGMGLFGSSVSLSAGGTRVAAGEPGTASQVPGITWVYANQPTDQPTGRPTHAPTSFSPTVLPRTNRPTTLAPTLGSMFRVTSGASYCQELTNAAGQSCVTDGVGSHGNNEACTVQVLAAGTISSTEFRTETCCDYVTIGGTTYRGTSGPQGVSVTENETFTWRSDSSYVNSGWVLCFRFSPTVAPSTAPVTTLPTNAAPTNPRTNTPTGNKPPTYMSTNLPTAAPLARTSSAPTSSAPTTADPTTGAPTTSAPTSAAPTTASPTTGAPTTSAPTSLAPTTVNPTTGAPTTSAPTSSAPTTAGPTARATTTSAPTSAAPTTAGPTTGAPTTSAPTSLAPTTAGPTAGAITTSAPTSSAPTTAGPTAGATTTPAPTSAAPTTAGPTTGAPTTSAPTSSAPTTAGPTAGAPTSAAPTTAGPTTGAPTTLAPTTSTAITSAPTPGPTTGAPTAATLTLTTSAPTITDPTTCGPTCSFAFSSVPTTSAPVPPYRPPTTLPPTNQPTTELSINLPPISLASTSPPTTVPPTTPPTMALTISRTSTAPTSLPPTPATALPAGSTVPTITVVFQGDLSTLSTADRTEFVRLLTQILVLLSNSTLGTPRIVLEPGSIVAHAYFDQAPGTSPEAALAQLEAMCGTISTTPLAIPTSSTLHRSIGATAALMALPETTSTAARDSSTRGVQTDWTSVSTTIVGAGASSGGDDTVLSAALIGGVVSAAVLVLLVVVVVLARRHRSNDANVSRHPQAAGFLNPAYFVPQAPSNTSHVPAESVGYVPGDRGAAWIFQLDRDGAQTTLSQAAAADPAALVCLVRSKGDGHVLSMLNPVKSRFYHEHVVRLPDGTFKIKACQGPSMKTVAEQVAATVTNSVGAAGFKLVAADSGSQFEGIKIGALSGFVNERELEV